MADITTYGLTPQGFVAKVLDVVRSDMEGRLRVLFNNQSLPLGDKSIFGQITGIWSEALTLVWELAEAVNSSQDPDTAAAAALDALCLLTGTLRPQARASVVMLTLFGVPGTLVTATSSASTPITNAKFKLDVDTTIEAVDAWAASTNYSVGDRVFSDTERIYQCITGGVSGGVAVSGTSADITDGTVHWAMIADHVPEGGAVDASATCTLTGPTTAGTGDITLIVDGVLGWNQVTNLAAATPGRNIASDEELREIRIEELSSNGGSTVSAILAKIVALTYMVSATVFTNNTDATNSDGMPPHSVEVLVRAPVGFEFDAAIAAVVFDNVAAGIATTGTTTVTITDSQSIDHDVSFSRPVEIPIYVAITLTKDPKTYPGDGDAQVAAAITDWGNARANGLDAVSAAILAQAFSIPGVLDVTVCNIGTAPSPSTNTTVAISRRQIATYATNHIVVTSSNGTP